MVKGVARRAIMVKSPDPELFEQAIFLLRDEAFRNGPEDQILREAQEVADGCIRRNSFPNRKAGRVSAVGFGFLGVLFATVFWILYYYVSYHIFI